MGHNNPLKNENGEIRKAGCVVLDEDNNVLLIGDLDGNWSFPKGHAEEGEVSEMVALREVKEETGIDVEIIKRLSDITYKHGKSGEVIRIEMFLARPLNMEIVPEKDTKVKFFTIEQAKEIIYPNLAFILNEL
jgi:8-oxo-dGTP diphosphatase